MIIEIAIVFVLIACIGFYSFLLFWKPKYRRFQIISHFAVGTNYLIFDNKLGQFCRENGQHMEFKKKRNARKIVKYLEIKDDN
ncbi:hypothetical protein LCGC14_0932780 [marine sediment metagenome]|uniref:Uncharacterized protein n=1 Tax=marine sediment metagenome TaxID=412755 RepID=A0A0F9R5X5_9ZZZZ